MPADLTPDAEASAVGLGALWQGLFFCSLGLGLPWLGTTSYHGLGRVARGLWAALPAADSTEPLWPLLQPGLRGLAQGLGLLIAGAVAMLGLVSWLQRWRLRAGWATATGTLLPAGLSLLLWGLGLGLLGSRWRGFFTWPDEAYGTAVLDGLRALLLLSGMTRLLRAGLLLFPLR